MSVLPYKDRRVEPVVSYPLTLRSIKYSSGSNNKMKQLRSIRKEFNARRKAKIAFSHPILPPVLIYQMGKVGSSTIHRSLLDTTHADQVLKLHFLSHDLPNRKRKYKKAGRYPYVDHVYLGVSTRRILNKYKDKPIKIISLLRDPIAIVISALFQNPHLAKKSITTDRGGIDPVKATDYINHMLHNPDTFSYIYGWFDKELKTVFDIDVFANPFPVKAGHTLYTKDNAEALVIRLEDLSEKGPEAISAFLCLEKPLKLQKGNLRSDSKSAEAYNEVLREIYLSPALCQEIYSSRFVKHFYSEKMIQEFMLKWTKSDSDKVI